jgi:hypothetical protein
MATIIKIKRSSGTAAPTGLGNGELGHTYGTGTTVNWGDRLFIGTGTETGGVAANIEVIGGKYFTDMLNHTQGTLTASSAIITDSNNKIDVLNVDNLKLDGNTITSENSNGDINITPNGTGSVVLDSLNYPQSDGTAGQFLKTDGSGTLTFGTVTSNFTLSADSGTDDTFNTGESLTFAGGEGIDTTVTNNTITISGEDATTSNKGIASFNSSDFSVTSGAVSLGSLANNQLDNSTVSYGGVQLSLGGTDTTPAFDLSDSTAYPGDSSLITVGTVTTGTWNASTIANAYLTNSTLSYGGVQVSLGGTDATPAFDLSDATSYPGDSSLVTVGTLNGLTVAASQTISMGANIVTNVADPSSAQDAATKAYVDATVNGLDVKDSVRVGTTANLSAAYNNSAGTLTASASGAITVDSVSLVVSDRILVKNQTTASQNGIYKVTTVGSGSASYVLTRTIDGNTGAELSGGVFFFVEEGTLNGDNGYVSTHNGTPTLGTTSIVFAQFSGAGQISAGAALSKTGNTIDVIVDDSSIELGGDYINVKALGITNSMLANTTINLTTKVTGMLPVANGGIGASSLTANRLIMANGTGALSVLGAGTSGQVMMSNGSSAPVFADIDGGTF